MALPIDVRDLLKSGRRLKRDRERTLVLSVIVEADVSDEVVDVLREALRPHTAGVHLSIMVPERDNPAVPDTASDAVIVAVGSGGAEVMSSLEAARQKDLKIVVLYVGAQEDVEALSLALGQQADDLLLRPGADQLIDALAAWLVREVPSKRLALAHNFDFVRHEVAAEVVRSTAMQNALIGAVIVIPGADMPLMTANQAKMLLRIAAAYGESLGVDRIKELAVIVGGGFTFRAAAREVVGLVPVLGWAVKGSIGYAGTMAMGRAAIAYFEQGADVLGVARHLRDEVADRLPSAHEPSSSAGTRTAGSKLVEPNMDAARD